MENKPILCLEFDGVIHRYSHGWGDGTIYDDVVDGFFEWAVKAQEYFRLYIYSARSKQYEGRTAIEEWLLNQFDTWLVRTNQSLPPYIAFEVVSERPPAIVYVDDRAVAFNGDWNSPHLKPELLRTMTPWNASLGITCRGELSASEAVYGFVNYLYKRSEEGMFSLATCDDINEICKEFCEANNFESPRPGWHYNLSFPAKEHDLNS